MALVLLHEDKKKNWKCTIGTTFQQESLTYEPLENGNINHTLQSCTMTHETEKLYLTKP